MVTNKNKVTCAKCKTVHNNGGTAFKRNGRYYCEKCLPELSADFKAKCYVCKTDLVAETAMERQEKGKTVHFCQSCYAERDREASTHKALVDYIYQKHDYKEKGIDGKYIAGQIKVLKSMYPHYKEAGMLASLKFYYDVCGNDVHPNPYKLIPYIYDEAKAFHERKRDIKNEGIKLQEEKMEDTRPRITIHSQTFNPRLKIKEINLDNI